MQQQHETFYGMLLAAAGFGIWALFSLVPVMAGSSLREAWDMAPYWIFGVPMLLALHGWAGAHFDSGAWRLPFWAVGGHILAMMLIHPTGTGLGLLPAAVVLIGIPMYVVLFLATMTGRMIGGRLRSA